MMTNIALAAQPEREKFSALPRSLAIALLVASSAMALGCARESTSGSGGGTLVISTASDADELFPPLVVTSQGRQVVEQIFEPLADVGDSLNVFGDAEFLPRLADSWTWASDSMSIAFHLNPRARWHDGKPVRAQDVAFTISLSKNPELAAPIAPLLSNIDSVTVRDSLTPVFWFRSRSAQQFYDAASVSLILPEHVYGVIPVGALASSDVLRHPVGSGRFRFKSWRPNASIEIVSNPDHYRAPARLSRVIWTISPGDFNAAATRFLTGDADLFPSVRAGMIPEIAKSHTERLIAYPGFNFGYMVFNMRDPANPKLPNPLFRDVAMRRALTMAVDRASLVRNVFDSLAVPSIGPAVRAMATTDTTIPQIPYDPADAMRILDSLGWHVGSGGMRARDGKQLAFTIMVPSSSKDREKLAVLMQNEYKSVGVKVGVLSVEPNVFERQQYAHKFDAAIEAWLADPSPGGLSESWGSEAAHTEGSKNYGDYASTTFDARLAKALDATSRAQARMLYSLAFRTLISDAPAVWLFEPKNTIGVADRLHLAPLRADAWWAHLADWYVPAGEQIARDRAVPVAEPNADTQRVKRSH